MDLPGDPVAPQAVLMDRSLADRIAAHCRRRLQLPAYSWSLDAAARSAVHRAGRAVSADAARQGIRVDRGEMATAESSLGAQTLAASSRRALVQLGHRHALQSRVFGTASIAY